MSSIGSTICSIRCPIRTTGLPGQWFGRNLDRADVAALRLPPLLPRLNVPVVHKVPMQAQLQLQRQVQHSQRALRQFLRIKDEDVIAQHIEVIDERDEVTLALGAIFLLGDERRLLERRRGPGKVDVLVARGERLRRVPGVVAQTVEEPPRGRPTLGKVVRSRGVDLGQPKVLVLLGHPPVIDAAELAVGRPDEGGRDVRVGLGLGVEDPARRRGGELVALGHLPCGQWVWGPPEEDIAVGDGEVDDNVAFFVLVAASDVALKGWLGRGEVVSV